MYMSLEVDHSARSDEHAFKLSHRIDSPTPNPNPNPVPNPVPNPKPIPNPDARANPALQVFVASDDPEPYRTLPARLPGLTVVWVPHDRFLMAPQQGAIVAAKMVEQVSQSQPCSTVSLTHYSPTRSPAHPLTHSPTHPPTHSPTHSPAHSPAHSPTHSGTRRHRRHLLVAASAPPPQARLPFRPRPDALPDRCDCRRDGRSGVRSGGHRPTGIAHRAHRHLRRRRWRRRLSRNRTARANDRGKADPMRAQ